MPVTPTYPGVYIEEVPSGVRTITGVSTSVAAFIDYFKKGPMDKAVQIFNMGDFEREFGGLDSNSEASYAIQQFFLNGGQEAWVIRTANDAVAANVQISDEIEGTTVLTVKAINEGAWGNNLQVSIDYNTSDPVSLFNMTVSEYVNNGGTLRLARSEIFRNLSMVSSSPRFVETVVNDETSGSKIIHVTASGTNLPLQNGTVSGDLSTFPTLTAASPAVNITIDTEGPFTANFSEKPATLPEARSILEAAIRSSKPDNPAFASAKVEIVRNRLRILAGPTTAGSCITFAPAGPDPALNELGLDSPTQVQGILSSDLAGFTGLTNDPAYIQVTIGAEGPHEVAISGNPPDLDTARAALETGLRAAHSSATFTGAQVGRIADRLLVLPGNVGDTITFASSGSDPALSELGLDSPTQVQGQLSSDLAGFTGLIHDPAHIQVTIGAEGPHEVAISGNPPDLDTARAALETGLRAAHSSVTFTGAQVGRIVDRLLVLPGTPGDTITFVAAPIDATTVNELKLNAGNATSNVQEYTLGAGAAIPGTAQGAGVSGDDGSPPDATALIGDLNNKKGIYALEDVDLFNILCIPRTAIVSGANALPEPQAAAVIAVARSYCEKRRAFFIIDTPNDIDEVQEIKDWLDNNATLRHKNSALYFPRVKVPDPLDEFRLRSFGASGTVAGLYARIDGTRGVWKAPAGTEATLANVQALDYTLTDEQNGTLNPQAINCLRNFAVYGNVCWGARTLDGADQMASEWKYIPVRRLALFIEESLYRGTKWVVFEPNDEPLWSQIRLNIGAFMHRLFRQGAFQGTTPKEAYFVKCDKETTTQTDINLGVVNIVVGFAPLKPAEFVIIKIQQMAGQIQT